MEVLRQAFIRNENGIGVRGIGSGSFVHLLRANLVRNRYGHIYARRQVELIEKYGDGPFEVKEIRREPGIMIVILYDNTLKHETFEVEEERLTFRI